jgi:hypothetical protein
MATWRYAPVLLLFKAGLYFTAVYHRWFCEHVSYFRAFFIKSVGGFLVHLQDQHVLPSPSPHYTVHTFRRFFFCAVYGLALVLPSPAFPVKIREHFWNLS